MNEAGIKLGKKKKAHDEQTAKQISNKAHAESNRM